MIRTGVPCHYWLSICLNHWYGGTCIFHPWWTHQASHQASAMQMIFTGQWVVNRQEWTLNWTTYSISMSMNTPTLVYQEFLGEAGILSTLRPYLQGHSKNGIVPLSKIFVMWVAGPYTCTVSCTLIYYKGFVTAGLGFAVSTGNVDDCVVHESEVWTWL